MKAKYSEKEVNDMVLHCYWHSVKMHAWYFKAPYLADKLIGKFDLRRKVEKEACQRLNILFKSPKYRKDIEIAYKNILRKKKYQPLKEYTNVLNNPLVRDFRNNKYFLTHVYPDHLRFSGGRNHWANTPFDLKILEVLAKYK